MTSHLIERGWAVIIPLYNKEQYIERCVRSVLAQTVSDIEIIVVDDGSTDNSLHAAKEIIDPRIKYVTQSNQGEGAARNAGLALSQRRWVAFLDADDMWLPEHLEELDHTRTECPSATLIATQFLEVRSGQFAEISSTSSPTRSVIDYFAEVANRPGIISSSTAAVDLAKIGAMQRFARLSRGTDVHFWASVALCHEVAISSRVTALYFRDVGGVSERKNYFADLGAEDAMLIDPILSIAVAALRSGDERKSLRLYIRQKCKSYANRFLYNYNIRSAVALREQCQPWGDEELSWDLGLLLQLGKHCPSFVQYLVGLRRWGLPR